MKNDISIHGYLRTQNMSVLLLGFILGLQLITIEVFAQKVSFVKIQHPLCQPPPSTNQPPAVKPPEPGEDPNRLPVPKPPVDLPVDVQEPESMGSQLLDKALAGELSKNILPFWHGYPWKKISHPKTWTAFTIQILKTEGKDLLASKPYDIGWYCPRYLKLNDEQKIAFWARFISILVEKESSNNPLSIMRDSGVGLNIFSTGLLQLSVASAQQKKWNCDMIKNQNDLFDWKKNLTCGVRIMNLLMKEDQALSLNPNHEEDRKWYGLARYWGPLRHTWISNREKNVCITEMLKIRTADWIAQSKMNKHPAFTTSEYKKAGENNFEQFVRLVNLFPYCHSE